MRYYFTPTRMIIIQKNRQYKSCKDVEKLKPSYTVGENIKWYNHFRK